MKKTEEEAIRLVMKYEKRQGRNPEDVGKERCGYDIKSGKLLIEVKGQSTPKPDFVQLYKKTLQKLGDDILKYYI